MGDLYKICFSSEFGKPQSEDINEQRCVGRFKKDLNTTVYLENFELKLKKVKWKSENSTT